MSMLELVRWGQVVGLSIGALCSIVFLIMYSRIWNIKSHITKFVISLNILFILTVLLVGIGRFIPSNIQIEIFKAVIFIAASLNMSIQIYLLHNIRKDNANDI